MGDTGAEANGPVCHRCLQPVGPKATRCRNCGTPVGPKPLSMSIVVGVLALLALLFVCWMMVKSIREEDIMNAPEDTTQSQLTQPSPAPANQPTPLNR